MKHRILLFAASLLLAVGCKPEELTVNQPYEDWTLLALSGNGTELSVIDQPENSLVQQDAYKATNGTSLPTGITSVVEFRDTLYFISPSEMKIEVATKFWGYKHVATLDFSSMGLKPADIAFPNATSGYIVFSNRSEVGVVDITQLFTDDMDKIFIKTIPVGNNPVSIAALGNKLLTANLGDNSVTVIDSRTLSAVKTIPVHTAPLFIRTDSDGKEAVLVSAGAGKISTGEAQTASRVQFISEETLEVTRSLTLYDKPTDSLSSMPLGLVVSNDEFAFVPLSTSLILVNTRQKQPSIRNIERKVYQHIFLNATRNEVVTLDTVANRVSVFSGRGGRASAFTIPVGSSVLQPY